MTRSRAMRKPDVHAGMLWIRAVLRPAGWARGCVSPVLDLVLSRSNQRQVLPAGCGRVPGAATALVGHAAHSEEIEHFGSSDLRLAVEKGMDAVADAGPQRAQ